MTVAALPEAQQGSVVMNAAKSPAHLSVSEASAVVGASVTGMVMGYAKAGHIPCLVVCRPH